jgi:hypothetical protein
LMFFAFLCFVNHEYSCCDYSDFKEEKRQG